MAAGASLVWPGITVCACSRAAVPHPWAAASTVSGVEFETGQAGPG